MDQAGLMDVGTTHHPPLPGTTESFTRTGKHSPRQIVFLWHLANLYTFLKPEIVQTIFIDHNGIKPEIGNRQVAGESLNV